MYKRVMILNSSLEKAFENGEKNIQINFKIRDFDTYRRKTILLSQRKSNKKV